MVVWRIGGGVEGNGDGEMCCGCLQVGIGKKARGDRKQGNQLNFHFGELRAGKVFSFLRELRPYGG